MAVTSVSFPMGELGFSGSGQFNGSEHQAAGSVMGNDGGSSNTSGDANMIAQVLHSMEKRVNKFIECLEDA